MLTQAGRLVLIKSVLQSIPIYFMATFKIPQKVISKISSLARRFFWGKVDKPRYMSLLAWEKLVKPIPMGGLGLRDMAVMNKALLLKMLWRLASGSDALWARQVREKYLPNSELWHSKRTSRCTGFWRALLELRPQLEPMVSWALGDGKECTVYAQPWFPNAIQHRPQVAGDGRLKVSELTNQTSGNWDVERISALFGYSAAIHIVTNMRPPSETRGPDSLIFNLNKNGRFSVKKAYKIGRAHV